MKVLIVTPTWIDDALKVAAIHPRCEAAIEAQRMSADIDWLIGIDNPYPIPDHRNVLHQYQAAREEFLAGEYAAFITVEHDNLLPDEGALQRMMDTPGDVIYAPYLLRHARPELNTWRYTDDRELGSSLSQYPDELVEARQFGIWPVCGAGMGCTLFRREVIEAIPFEATGPDNPCPDLGFARAALRAGFRSYGRFDVPVAHYSRGRWLYPFTE